MYQVGLSTNGKVVNEELFINCERAGIKAMEIALDEDKYADFDYDTLKIWADRHNIKLWSLHLPFRPIERVNLAAFEDSVRNGTIEYYTDIIKKAARIGIKIFVVHPNSGEPIEEGEVRTKRIELVKECLNILAENAAKEGGVIAVENLPRSCIARNSAELLELLEVNDKLRVCYDTNHLMGQEATEFIKAVGKKIITLHVSDYDFMNERHWLPGEGKNDWQKILKSLMEVGYNGVWLYEVRFACPNTIIRDRELNCDDFMKNARELFENIPITVISKQKENLGMWG